MKRRVGEVVENAEVPLVEVQAAADGGPALGRAGNGEGGPQDEAAGKQADIEFHGRVVRGRRTRSTGWELAPSPR